MEKRNRNSRRRLVARIIILIFVLIIFYFLVKPFAKIDFQLANLKLESIQLDNQIAKLENDLNFEKSKLSEFSTEQGITNKARQKFSMVYPGETLYECRDSQGYLIFENKYQKLTSNFKRKNAISTAWDMFLSLFR